MNLSGNIAKTDAVLSIVERQHEIWKHQSQTLKQLKADLKAVLDAIYNHAKTMEESEAFAFVRNVERLLTSKSSNLVRAYILSNARTLSELNSQLRQNFNT